MDSSRRLGLTCIILATAFWSLTHIFVKHLSLHGIEADVQNLYRYGAAAAGLWVMALGWFRQETAAAVRRVHLFVLPAVINFVFQVCMVSGLYQASIYPGVSNLLSKSSTLFATVMAFILFREERPTILSARYLAGLALACGGLAGVVLLGPTARLDFQIGVLFVTAGAFLWALYTVAMKPIVREVRPMVAFTMVSTLTALFFLVLASFRSDPAQILAATPLDKFYIVISGLLCISAAHSLYFRAIERLGVAVCAGFLLLTPLLAMGLSRWLLKEEMRASQALMGLVLLAGIYFTTRAPIRRAPPER